MSQTQHNQLKESVLRKITDEGVRPVPKMWFTVREYLVWGLWAISVLVGALAVAVIIYVAIYNSTAFIEATHASPILFYFEFLPYAWLTIFILMWILAYYNLRHTKSGYRYPFWQIIGSSLAFSIVGGLLLHFAGIGYAIDSSLGAHMPLYKSQERLELQLWQQPAEGRLVGSLATITVPHLVAMIVDANDTTWTVSINELHKPDEQVLRSGDRVRILGIASSTAQIFHACGVFPWMFARVMGYKELAAERTAFLDRMAAHQKSAQRLQELHQATAKRQPEECAGIPVVERVSRSSSP